MPVELVNVAVMGEKKGTTTNEKGYFTLTVAAEKEISVAFSFIGFSDKQVKLKLKEGETKEIKVVLKILSTTLPGFEVKDERLRTESMVRIIIIHFL